MPLPLIPQVWGRLQICMFTLVRAFTSLLVILVLFPEYGAAFSTTPVMLRGHQACTAQLSGRNQGLLVGAKKLISAECVKRSVALNTLNTDSDAASINEAGEDAVATLDELQESANRVGMYFTMTWLGPVYRCVIRKLPEEGEEKGQAIGFTTGSIIGSLIRQDTMRISNVNSGNELSKKRPDEIAGRGWKSPHVLGLGILLGAYPLRVAYDQGVKKAQLLAICDEERQFKILRRHYMRLGLKPIKELTDDITCVPDRMIWGGVGTLMEADVKEILSRHTAELRKIGTEN